ncbi:sensor histidine kinase KdpD [Robiginitalea sp. SC105]|uniref:sensor histidine kinase n=1 Tax=Robiginitalea sp. SC105 TaxID=2762332 RepID=UPI00163B0C75|nr:HAMP domain-containing sensor histidine kinase [Robiginitalea sp. SC105]MBC2839085.1 HAMP domain-containing histidine kinase [Robiginitalea sp. SC105]
MNRKVLFIALFVISIGGLAFVQYRYLRIGLSLARLQFGQHIADAGGDIRSGLYGNNQLTYLLGSVLERDSTRFNTGLDHMTDASRHFLEDYLREKLIDNEIDADFTFELMTRDSSYYLTSAVNSSRPTDRRFAYPIELEGYLPMRIGQRLILQLQFADLTTYFLLQLNGLTFPSLLFLAGILVAVLWVLRTYYWQQRTISTTHEFINNLTHELRTPVFSISLAAKILKEKVPEEQKALTETILQQTARVSGHIDQVLELGSLERASASIPLEPIDFAPALGVLCEQFRSLCELEGIPFEFELPDGPILLDGSVFHLENTVNNLLDNARKYGKGSPVHLSARRQSGRLLISVSDQGPGMAAEEKSRIFKKYYRITEGDRQDVRGYGLGLSYVKTVIDRHRGTIRVKSQPGRGTEITVELPLRNHGEQSI